MDTYTELNFLTTTKEQAKEVEGVIDAYINTHGKRLFGLCQKLCHNREDAEDLYQETWIKAYKHLQKYDANKEFEGWLVTICVNSYRDLLRRQKWQSLFARFSSNEEKEFVLSNIPVAEKSDYTDVRDAVNRLAEKYRLVTILYYFHDLDIKKTAAILKIPEGTVKYQLHKARELLKRRLESNG